MYKFLKSAKLVVLLVFAVVLLASCHKQARTNIETDQGELSKDEIRDQLIKLEKDSDLKYSSSVSNAIKGYNVDGIRPFLLRDMMDIGVIELAQYTKTFNDPMNALARFNYWGVLHSERIYNALREGNDKDKLKRHQWIMWMDNDYSIGNRYAEIVGAPVLQCAGYASININVLRWIYGDVSAGIIDGKVSVDPLKNDYHALGFVEVNGLAYMIDNRMIYEMKDNKLKAVFNELEVTDFNKSYKEMGYYEFDYRVLSTFSKRYEIDNVKRLPLSQTLNNGISKSLGKQIENQIPIDELIEVDTGLQIDEGGAKELALRAMYYVYQQAYKSDDLDYDLSKYALHSKWVKYPEYYLKSYLALDQESGVIVMDSIALNERYKSKMSFDSILSLAREIEINSVYEEEYRIMIPEHIMIFNEADVIGRSFLVQILMEYNKIDALTIISNNRGYLLVESSDEESIIYDLDSGERATLKGESIDMIIDSNQVYYPLMNRNNLSEVSLQKLKGVGIKIN